MDKDYLRDLELTGVTARIRRLNDRLQASGKKIYKLLNLDIEPNWHLVLLVLEDKNSLTVTEVARILDFSHPAVIKITRKMIQKNYLMTETDDCDGRKQRLSLTTKAIRELPKLKEKWGLIRQAHQEYITEEFMQELTRMEIKLKDKSIDQRILDKLS